MHLKVDWLTNLTRKLDKGSEQDPKEGFSKMDEKLFDLNRFVHVGHPMPRRQRVVVREETAVEHGPGSFNISEQI